MNTSIKNVILTPFNILYKISPELDLKILFRIKNGYRLNLKEPKTYSEKLQWIKLYEKKDLMPICCDKYTVRKYVSEQGCDDILNELIWSGFDPREIPFKQLPEKYVIKVTHGSTFNIICTEKNKIREADVIKKCKKWLKAKFIPCYGEWFYGVEKPRIIVENFIESLDGKSLKDYKIYCFNGEPTFVAIHSERFEGHKIDMYDINWKRMKGRYADFPDSPNIIPRPERFDDALEYARKLSAPFKHARVDFYIEGNKVIFGEITFTPGAGFDKFTSYEFDLELGKMFSI